MHQQNLLVNQWGGVGVVVAGTQCLLEVHLLMASLQEQLDFQVQCLTLWELALCAVWAKTHTTHPLKLQTYTWIKSPLYFCETSDLLPLISLFLSYLLTPTTRTLPSCRQHHSIPLIIKILLMPLTGPDNPLLCHYFCYYLEWICDNEMFTIGDTLNCSYGGLWEESVIYIPSEQ